MSTELLRVIPTDPNWVPGEQAAGDALAVLRDLAPLAREITIDRFDEVEFVDQGGYFDAVRCPACGRELDTGWWGNAMDDSYRSHFEDLRVCTPCCRTETTLNDLDYVGPAGFARFVLEAADPNFGPLSDDGGARIARALGHAIRVVWARY